MLSEMAFEMLRNVNSMNNVLKASAQPSRYRIWGLVGRGQFGKVYVARDRLNQEIVALKQLDQKLPTNKFLRELRFLLSLNHENIVAYIALEHHRQSRFLVMEYCEAGTLRDAIAYGNRLTYRQILQILIDVLQGLDCAHRLQIIHCDLKPENILLKLTAQGYLAKISDFGVARIVGERNREDSQNSGSPGYMAPERFYGQFSVASDIYAVGIMLYELLLHERPFSGMPKELMFAHLNQRVQIPATLHSPLADILSQSLEKLPRKRFRSAEQMRLVLLRLLDLYPIDRDLQNLPEASSEFNYQKKIVPVTSEWLVENLTIPVSCLSTFQSKFQNTSVQKLTYCSQNQIWQKKLAPNAQSELCLNLTQLTPIEKIVALNFLEDRILFRSDRALYLHDLDSAQTHVLYHAEQPFYFAVLPSQSWLAIASDCPSDSLGDSLSDRFRGSQIEIHSLKNSQKILVDLPFRQVQGIVALNSNHFATIASEPDTGQSKLLIVARRGQIMRKLPICEAIAQVHQSLVPDLIVLVTASFPNSLLVVDLNPYRVRRYFLDFQVDLLVATPWGFLASTHSENHKTLVKILDNYAQKLGELEIDGRVTAMTTVQSPIQNPTQSPTQNSVRGGEAQGNWIAIAAQVIPTSQISSQSNSQIISQIYLIDLKQLEVDLIF
jgi:serine/threonine protein kinase